MFSICSFIFENHTEHVSTQVLSKPSVLQNCNFQTVALELCVKVCVYCPAHALQHDQVHALAPHLLREVVVESGEVQAGATLATVPGDQHLRVEAGADDLRHLGDLAQEQRQLGVGHVVEDGPRVGAEDDACPSA